MTAETIGSNSGSWLMTYSMCDWCQGIGHSLQGIFKIIEKTHYSVFNQRFVSV